MATFIINFSFLCNTKLLTNLVYYALHPSALQGTTVHMQILLWRCAKATCPGRAHIPFALHPLPTCLLFFKCRFVTFGCHLCERHSMCVCLCVFAPLLSPCGACVYGFLIVCLCLKNLPAPSSCSTKITRTFFVLPALPTFVNTPRICGFAVAFPQRFFYSISLLFAAAAFNIIPHDSISIILS